MKYAKPALTFDQQADLLIKRGMIATRHQLVEKLRVANYYRLSGYWFPFRKSDDSFQADTRFDQIWERYLFDSELRLLTLKAIERIEIAIRSRLAYEHAHRYGAFAYIEDSGTLPHLTPDQRQLFFKECARSEKKANEVFVKHFHEKYGDNHRSMPIWMACELFTFGMLVTMYRGVEPALKQSMAASFEVHDKVFTSWILSIHALRNICAHHGRFWNSQLGVKPLLPDKDSRWRLPIDITNEHAFGILSVCVFLLQKIESESIWADELIGLFAKYPSVPTEQMGFPGNWLESPIWRSAIKADRKEMMHG